MGWGGVVALTDAPPFGRQVRMQAPARDPAHRYMTAWGTFAHIVREEKVRHFAPLEARTR